LLTLALISGKLSVELSKECHGKFNTLFKLVKVFFSNYCAGEGAEGSCSKYFNSTALDFSVLSALWAY